uniref:Endoplasmic reticulum lectin 1 n=1 Tax=Mesocestoides corti TaxID=53468 RepID=A0A5K3F859_MESCO
MRPLLAFQMFLILPLFSFGYFNVSDEYLYSVVWNSELSLQSNSAPPLIMKTRSNETYICHFPAIIKDKSIPYTLNSSLHPNSLLSDFFGKYPCIFKVDGYWTYELCHNKHIRQFRAEGAGPQLTRLVKEYYLGRISNPISAPKGTEVEVGDVGLKSIRINGKDFPYYSVEYDDGTECDLTSAPRKASVLYVCVEESDGELFQISELETCVYQLVVFTRHLCSSPLFNSHKVYSNPVNCAPHDDITPVKPTALIAFEKEVEELSASSEYKHLEGIFSSLKVKGLKVEKLNNRGTVVYRVRTLDPLVADQEGETVINQNKEHQELNTKETHDVNYAESPPTTRSQTEHNPSVLNQRVSHDLRLTQKRELQSFMSGETCLTGDAGWWRHEVCYGSRVTQYHEDPESGERIEIVLGKWDEAVHLEWVRKSRLRKPSLPAEKRNKLTQFYGQGDFCEEIKAHRTVRLSFVCQRKISTAVQLSFSEPTVCQYSINLESPLFCDLLRQADDDGLFPQEVVL